MELNGEALDRYQSAIKELHNAGPAPWPTELWDKYEMAMTALHRSAIEAMEIGDTPKPEIQGRVIYTPDGSRGLYIVDHQGHTVTLTEDGSGVIRNAWHEGLTDDEVFYEVYTVNGRHAHGWVDRETRKLTQTG